MTAKGAIPETTRRTTCRVCGCGELTELYSLGELCVSDFVAPGEEGRRAPLELVMCPRCSLVQLRHTAPQELLYRRFYWYRSGVTDTMRAALAELASSLQAWPGLKAGDVALDIGSNDGTLLRGFRVPGLVTVGVEPASNLAEEGRKGLSRFIGEFWSFKPYWDAVGRKAKVITAIGMFYDMEDPNQFVRDAARALADDGVFVAQLMCLKNMIDSGDVGNICHEHLEFYSLSALDHMFSRNGLEIVDIERNEVNGGSYRLFCRLKGSSLAPRPGAAERVRRFRAQEEALSRPEVHRQFFRRMEENKRRCVDFIKAERAKGKRVWVYGASTKGNTILQYFGLDSSLIEAASERSPEKWGKETVGTRIPIVSEEEARRAKPDYFLVLPYAFFDEFYRREAEWRRGGGKFIVPLPEFRVVA
ncbi:MAG: class I SAM-dependent methyltransferase [Elusimicrobia bacterium]|nr:class I SAM-dependent methyltransferase [Elusimicrobiota bacterium]MDE2425051.1 class I SAM-dependent methyltransferase [Elusimicrobiota bacterium]